MACCGRRAFASLRRTSPGANPAPCAALDLQRIHRVITRGLAVLRQSCPDFIAAGFHDDATRDGFWKYCQALEANTHGHHLAEDDLFFPFVADRLPEAAVGALERPLPALQLRARRPRSVYQRHASRAHPAVRAHRLEGRVGADEAVPPSLTLPSHPHPVRKNLTEPLQSIGFSPLDAAPKLQYNGTDRQSGTVHARRGEDGSQQYV